MKIKMPKILPNVSPRTIKVFLIAFIIIILLCLLSYCMNKRVERFENIKKNVSDEDETKENFIDLSTLGIDLGDSNSGKKLNSLSDVKTSFRDSSDFKGSDNKDLLKQIMPVDQIKNKNLDKVPDLKNKVLNNAIEAKIKSQGEESVEMMKDKKQLLSANTQQRIKEYIQNDTFKNSSNILGTCNFYNDECPDDYTDMGSIGFINFPIGMTLLCGNVSSTSPASFTAEISNGSIKDVIIKNPGAGYNLNKKYNMTVTGGRGNGASLEPIIGDDGTIKQINVKNRGSGYMDTPTITIENSANSGKCHFCCKK